MKIMTHELRKHCLNGLTHESKTHAFLTRELDAGKHTSCKVALRENSSVFYLIFT